MCPHRATFLAHRVFRGENLISRRGERPRGQGGSPSQSRLERGLKNVYILKMVDKTAQRAN